MRARWARRARRARWARWAKWARWASGQMRHLSQAKFETYTPLKGRLLKYVEAFSQLKLIENPLYMNIRKPYVISPGLVAGRLGDRTVFPQLDCASTILKE
jgi:hypothetical protein